MRPLKPPICACLSPMPMTMTTTPTTPMGTRGRLKPILAVPTVRVCGKNAAVEAAVVDVVKPDLEATAIWTRGPQVLKRMRPLRKVPKPLSAAAPRNLGHRTAEGGRIQMRKVLILTPGSPGSVWFRAGLRWAKWEAIPFTSLQVRQCPCHPPAQTEGAHVPPKQGIARDAVGLALKG